MAAHGALKQRIIETPVLDCSSAIPIGLHGPAKISMKMELFQKTGSFKIRGALNMMSALSRQQIVSGVTAFSGGNHAIAVAYAAKHFGTSAKVVMPKTASPSRISACKEFGAEVFLVETRAEAPKLAMVFQENEGRILVPPFEHNLTVLGTATLGYEFINQIPSLDVIFVPVGGGGLAAGVACAIKQFSLKCKVIGVQPKNADAMYRSLKSGKPEFNEKADTIADSLCPPQVGSYTLSMCQQFLDDLWVVDDYDTKKAMRLLFDKFKVVVEGAGAIGLAAVLSDQAKTLSGKHVGIILSGSNIDFTTFVINSEIGTKND